MLDAAWLPFVIASLLVISSPGQDMLIVLSRSLAQGRLAGVVTAAGVSVGLLGHTVLATLGLGAILRTSEWMFVVLKIVGAAYLVYLGVRLVLTRSATLATASAVHAPLRRHFMAGALSNLSNPKIAIFYFAFLPQFVAADSARPTATIFVLGAAFAALTFAIKAPIGVLGGSFAGWLRTRPAALTWIYRASGLALIGLGVRLALERRPA
jgi:threonine/homoserine/homoserine lactone efflux protein